MQHGPAPDHRLIVFHQKAQRHEADAERLGWNQRLADRRGRRLCAQHHRNGRPVDIRIHQPDPAASLGQRDGQVHGERAFPHAAFAAADRDDMLDRRYAGSFAGNGLARYRLRAAFQDYIRLFDARNGHHDVARVAACELQIVFILAGNGDFHFDQPIANRDTADEVPADDIFLLVRPLDRLQRIVDSFLGHFGHRIFSRSQNRAALLLSLYPIVPFRGRLFFRRAGRGGSLGHGPGEWRFCAWRLSNITV